MQHVAPVELFWTSGWDSTFRLLQLLLDHRVPVAPIYVVDPTRGSAAIERLSLERLRDALFDAHPHTRVLLQPVREVPMSDLAQDAAVTAAFHRIASHVPLGDQYEWLARYCKQYGVRGVELSCEHTYQGPHAVLHSIAERVIDPHGLDNWRVPPEYADEDVQAIFGAYTMPLFEMTKEQTAVLAREKGWLDLLGLTWFCHRPTGNDQPCGLCNPCMYAIKQGFGWRISPTRRAASAVYKRTLYPVRRMARRMLMRSHAGPTPLPSAH
ncbi:hypothetical protein LF41_279 [Lysobacter dokdonensis DS-58]|uniref:7-cyano-7-deazaguanine synthase n=1 Tax=Lysobacter dokdonensis DS-58 TaxID=1300345 RepID=A0A0A2WEX2_9GAMM|nr:7-cyano-7-deazaguanine synthase [Lysobacter dokdonensis]KGQ18746.1 hypothetical protein LF41_279 [Lysobacter dokdonensis DS-58]